MVLGRDHRAAETKAKALQAAGIGAPGPGADVLDAPSLVRAREALLAEWGQVDILINARPAGNAEARTDNAPAFEQKLPAYEDVVRLNLHGTVYPTLVFGEAMARRGKGASSTSRRWPRRWRCPASSATRWRRRPSRASPDGWRSTSRDASATASA
ncbi:MAG: SDR family NAD(P)-dependent oxidoreductase [Vicinamibacteria bacterium]